MERLLAEDVSKHQQQADSEIHGSGSPTFKDPGGTDSSDETNDSGDADDSDDSGGDDSTGDGTLEVVAIHADAAGNDHENLNDEYIMFENTGGSALDLTG